MIKYVENSNLSPLPSLQVSNMICLNYIIGRYGGKSTTLL